MGEVDAIALRKPLWSAVCRAEVFIPHVFFDLSFFRAVMKAAR
jgi:hypothetical protein